MPDSEIDVVFDGRQAIHKSQFFFPKLAAFPTQGSDNAHTIRFSQLPDELWRPSPLKRK
jgi:hypothetical protein